MSSILGIYGNVILLAVCFVSCGHTEDRKDEQIVLACENFEDACQLIFGTAFDSLSECIDISVGEEPTDEELACLIGAMHCQDIANCHF